MATRSCKRVAILYLIIPFDVSGLKFALRVVFEIGELQG